MTGNTSTEGHAAHFLRSAIESLRTGHNRLTREERLALLAHVDSKQSAEPSERPGADIALLYCTGCGNPPGTERNTPICAAFDEQGDGEGGTSHQCATCGHNRDCHEPVFPEYAIRQFCGYLTAALPELHQIHPDRVWRAWLGLLKKAQPETKAGGT